jgi:hypothetical protein
MAKLHLGIAFAVAALSLAGCTGSPLGTSNQVVVHLDADPNDIAAAQRVADAECHRRGGTARFIAKLANDNGPREFDDPSPPDAFFACDPLAPAATPWPPG